jgi:O-antigen ligase
MLRAFQICVPLFLLWVPTVGLIASGIDFPHGPGSDVGIVSFKGGDMGVHLGGAAAFLAFGLYSENPGWRWPLGLLWVSWLAGVVVAGGLNRGGLLAAGISLLVAFAIRPSVRMIQFAGIVGLIVLVAWIANLRVDIGDSGKHISVDEMTKRVSSVFGNEDEALEGTRAFRLEWWGEIASYTFTGPYFWGGKGFGVNLATDDGFQFDAEETLRAPHNSHMTVLARMGVPGFAMWIALQAAFAVSLWIAMRKAQSAGLTRWASIDAWLLVYWLAICLNASFDPYLEGPQGGIWYWSMIGIGIYVLRLQRIEIDQVERARRRRAYTMPPRRPPPRTAGEAIA